MPDKDEAQLRVLLVCMGNICRSPMAEGALRHRILRDAGAPRVFVDSAGTHGYHRGAPPDPRAQAAAARRGIEIGHLRARQVVETDFAEHDLILAMDQENLAWLRAEAPADHQDKLRMFLDFSASWRGQDVPDPYYGGPTCFEKVLDLVEEAVDGLLDELRRQATRRAAMPR